MFFAVAVTVRKTQLRANLVGLQLPHHDGSSEACLLTKTKLFTTSATQIPPCLCGRKQPPDPLGRLPDHDTETRNLSVSIQI